MLTKKAGPDEYVYTGYVLDLIHVQNFNYLTVAWEKMSIFLQLI